MVFRTFEIFLKPRYFCNFKKFVNFYEFLVKTLDKYKIFWYNNTQFYFGRGVNARRSS